MVMGTVADSCRECSMPITSVRACKSRRAGLCSKCFKRLYDKAYREGHKGRYKEYAQRYYQANREKLREKNTAQKRRWRDANRTHYREYQRDYKRRIRGAGEHPREELSETCSRCGGGISSRWGARSRQEGLCPGCYRRRAQSQYYRRVKSRRHGRSSLAAPSERQKRAAR